MCPEYLLDPYMGMYYTSQVFAKYPGYLLNSRVYVYYIISRVFIKYPGYLLNPQGIYICCRHGAST